MLLSAVAGVGAVTVPVKVGDAFGAYIELMSVPFTRRDDALTVAAVRVAETDALPFTENLLLDTYLYLLTLQ